MATTEYTTLSEAKVWLGITGTSQDTVLPYAINAAARAVDNFCGRRFWRDDAATARVFTPEFHDLLIVNDIGSTTGLVIESDDTSDGTYEHTWVENQRTGYGFRLEPVNALAGAEPEEREPYTRIRALAGEFPILDYGVRITAQWGWPSVPSTITLASLMLVSRLWKRKDAVLGVAGGAEVGFVELARRLDPDIQLMLNPYRRFEVRSL